MIGGDAESGDEHRPVGELVGAIGGGEQDGRGTVGLRAAVEQMEWRAHGRRCEHLLDRDLVLEVRVRIE